MQSQNIRIRLKAYDHRVLDTSTREMLFMISPPTSTSRVTPEEAALAMARGASKVLRSDVTMALTGVAGPTEQDGMPVGTLCVAITWPAGELTRTFRLPGQRQQMRQFSVINSLDLLRRTISG